MSARVTPQWALPIVVLIVVVVMSALGISGSSVSRYDVAGGLDRGLLAGSPRVVRADEYDVRAPLVVSRARDGFARTADSGVGTHDMAVLYDLPVADWATLFRPHLWGYFVLPLEQAHALDWWAVAAVLVLGVYALLLVVVSDWRWAALGAVAMWASPFVQWWYLSFTLALVGYACAGVAAFLVAVRTEPSRRRGLLLAASVALLGCAVLTFYPPFLIPTAIVLAGLATGLLGDEVRGGALAPRRLAVDAAVVVGGVAVVGSLFLLTHRAAVSAIAHTVYPGIRSVAGGDWHRGTLGSAWLGWAYERYPDQMRGLVLPNESEGSSFLFLGLFLVPALPLLWRSVGDGANRLRAPVVGTACAAVLLFGHAFIGWPTPLLVVTGLNRVPPGRVLIGLGLASMMLVAMVGRSLQERPPARWARVGAAALVAVLAVLAVVGLGAPLRDAGAPVGAAPYVVTLLVAAAVCGAFVWRPLVATVALVAVGAVVSLAVNPLQRGLDPLTDSAFGNRVVQVDEASGRDGRWLAAAEGTAPIVTAEVGRDLSGVNLYPDADAWRVLDPTGAAEQTWNRFAHTVWRFAPAGAPTTFSLEQADIVAVSIDPCSEALTTLDVRHIVSAEELHHRCLRLVDTSTTPAGGSAHIYERSVAP